MKSRGYSHIIIHYSEIGLKGKNRHIFENLLMRNIKVSCRLDSIKKERGYFICRINRDEGEIAECLRKVPGVANFLIAEKCSLKTDKIAQCAEKAVKSAKDASTFKIVARRHNKQFSKTSIEINREIGAFVAEKTGKKVVMKNPDVQVHIEICQKSAFVGTQKIKAVGGLPTDPKNKIVCLLSGGFDSPVAAYLLMKRGAKIIFVHFQNYSQMKSSVKDKIDLLVNALKDFQCGARLYIVPFEKLQKKIIANVPAGMRMLIYRRFMLRIASKIAETESAKVLATGDNLSQVSSQTIENLSAVYPASDKIIFAPLIGFNKEEIIEIAKKIGTEKISALPYGDCCSFFMPKHPKTKAKSFELERAEKGINVASLTDDAVSNAVIKEFLPGS